MSELRIRDLYTGMPDARDEVDFADEDSFIESFVMPPNFDLEGLLRGHQVPRRRPASCPGAWKESFRRKLLIGDHRIVRKKVRRNRFPDFGGLFISH